MSADELLCNRRRWLLLQTRNIQATQALLRNAGFSNLHSSNGVIKLDSSGAVDRPDEIARLLVEAGHAPTIISITPIVFFASAGHGYLPPMGAAILSIFLSQMAAVAGWGDYFPWSIPALYAQGAEVGAASYLIVVVTGIAGMVATFLWWEMADHHG